MRKICDNCKTTVEIPKEVLERVGFKPKEKVKFYKGKGCSKCNNTGYYGRFGILEALTIDDEIRDMILAKVHSDKIKEYAVNKKGMITLHEAAMENFTLGNTTLEEVLRGTAGEE